ncbi:hypothetical protein [Hymenobacter sp. BT730]|uniref:hypothetical protein n=1 Tax=Hymenobacter sp. BT730 TaxID=3063332 RepID=UPI0026DFBD6D|nr:hypothetical protein [Hymenobacter sp. BT730]
MRKSILAFLWLLALPLLATTCHKPQPEPEAVPLPAELKAYTRFRPGTYWIYQDSVTGRLDSTWVVSLKDNVYREYDHIDEWVPMKHEVFGLRTRSAWGGTDVVYSVNRNCGLPIREDEGDNGFPCWMIMRGQYLPTSTADEGSAHVFPYRIPKDQRVLRSSYATWHSQPLTVAGKEYADVMEVSLPVDASEGGWPAYYAWVPHLGIVLHRVRYQGKLYTWTLLRSHIVQ